jgi:hypothetical protein
MYKDTFEEVAKGKLESSWVRSKLIARLYGEINWRSGSSNWQTKIQSLQDHRSAFCLVTVAPADNQESNPTVVMGNTKSNSRVVKSLKTAS